MIAWVAHSADHGFARLWDLPIFHPVRGALAFSDHDLLAGMLAALLPAAWPRALVVYDLLVLLSFAACATATAWVLRRSGMPDFAAWVGGVVYAFCPYRWDSLSHFQVLLAQCIPLLLWLWDRLLAERRPRTAVAFLLVYALHMLGGAYLAYMVHVPLLVIALVRLRAHGRELLRPPALRVLLPTVVAAAAIAASIYGPYVIEGQRLGLERRSSEIVQFGTTLESYLTPSALDVYGGLWRQRFERPENTLFPGHLATALAAIGVVVLLRRRRGASRSWARRGIAVALLIGTFFALALGDAQTRLGPARADYQRAQRVLALVALGWLVLLLLRWRRRDAEPALSTWERGLLLGGLACALLGFPAVFLPARGWLPGLGGMRVPARFYPFVAFALAYLAALGAAVLVPRLRGTRALAIAAAMLLLLALDVVPRAVAWTPVPRLPAELPPTHRWLRAHARDVRAYLELPMDNWTMEIAGMYDQTAHWVPAVNGYSGYVPSSWWHVHDCCSGPWMGPEQVTELRRLGVTHLLLAAWKTPPGELGNWLRLERRLVRQGLARVRLREQGDVVLELLAPPASAARHRGAAAALTPPDRGASARGAR